MATCVFASSWCNDHAWGNRLASILHELLHVEPGRLGHVDCVAHASCHNNLQYNCQCSDCEDPNIYPKGRFISEFGIQSYPNWDTLTQAMGSADLYVDSAQMYWRQRKFSEAPSSVFNFVSQRFRLPADCKWPWATAHRIVHIAQSPGRNITAAQGSYCCDLFCVLRLHCTHYIVLLTLMTGESQ